MRMNSGGEAGVDASLGSDKSLPKDGQVMVSILKDMGINEFEPRVVNQLLEFAYRYMTTVLDDAKTVSAHAKKKALDTEDIKLAVQMYAEENMTSPPGRDVLLETARTRNTQPLPIPKPSCGLRLPPDRFCITSCNYKLAKPARKSTLTKPGTSMFSNQVNPSTPKMSLTVPSLHFNQLGIGIGGIKRKASEIDNGDP